MSPSPSLSRSLTRLLWLISQQTAFRHNMILFEMGAEFRARAARYWQHPNPRFSRTHANRSCGDRASHLAWKNRRPTHLMHSEPIASGTHRPLLKPPVVYLCLCWAADRNRRRHDCIIASITEMIYTSIISPSAHIPALSFHHYPVTIHLS